MDGKKRVGGQSPQKAQPHSGVRVGIKTSHLPHAASAPESVTVPTAERQGTHTVVWVTHLACHVSTGSVAVARWADAGGRNQG